MSCYGTVSTIIKLRTSSPNGRNHRLKKKSGCAGDDQDVRADSVTPPGPQYLGVGTTLLQTVTGTPITGPDFVNSARVVKFVPK